jgi:hypothetical protein
MGAESPFHHSVTFEIRCKSLARGLASCDYSKHLYLVYTTQPNVSNYHPVIATIFLIPRNSLQEYNAHLVGRHFGAGPIVNVVLEIAIAHAKFEFLQKRAIFHEIERVKHVAAG